MNIISKVTKPIFCLLFYTAINKLSIIKEIKILIYILIMLFKTLN
jgi:hypothetical protein